jgi:hypothetical protein
MAFHLQILDRIQTRIPGSCKDRTRTRWGQWGEGEERLQERRWEEAGGLAEQ